MDTNIARTSRFIELPARKADQRESLVKAWYKASTEWFTNAISRQAGYRSVTIDTALDKRHFSAADIELLQYRQGINLR